MNIINQMPHGIKSVENTYRKNNVLLNRLEWRKRRYRVRANAAPKGQRTYITPLFRTLTCSLYSIDDCVRIRRRHYCQCGKVAKFLVFRMYGYIPLCFAIVDTNDNSIRGLITDGQHHDERYCCAECVPASASPYRALCEAMQRALTPRSNAKSGGSNELH